MPELDEPSEISQAIEYLGGPRVLAKKLGITYQGVNKWNKKISAERARDIQVLSASKFTLQSLRPDLFPNEALQP